MVIPHNKRTNKVQRRENCIFMIATLPLTVNQVSAIAASLANQLLPLCENRRPFPPNIPCFRLCCLLQDAPKIRDCGGDHWWGSLGTGQRFHYRSYTFNLKSNTRPRKHRYLSYSGPIELGLSPRLVSRIRGDAILTGGVKFPSNGLDVVTPIRQDLPPKLLPEEGRLK